MRKSDLDAFAYIEGAFVDAAKQERKARIAARNGTSKDAPQRRRPVEEMGEPIEAPSKLKKTGMKAPRPRRAKKEDSVRSPLPKSIADLVERAPKHLTFLAGLYDDHVTQKYYSAQFKESREELIRRMLDPELNLEETARLLGVCPATVRRYTNRKWLKHHRTSGNQRRFTLAGIVEFVEKYGRNPE